VGVSEDYHRFGELGEDVYTMFIPVNFETSPELPHEVMIRVRPGTTAMFEERLVRTLQAVAPQWTFDTEYLPSKRRSVLFMSAAPLLLGVVVGTSLIIMVGLGLVGVLWLNVTRRTSELGLRRAMGASAASVRGQVLGELWALTALAVLAGTVIFLQLPLFGANFGASWAVFVTGVVLASLILFSFVTVCGLYPAWLATRVQPATALQHE
jgi:putative ABC transport system permease protein